MVFISLAQCRGGKDRASHVYRQCLCTSLASRLITAVFGLGTRFCMREKKLENGILSNRQQPQSVVNGFGDQGKFEAMKTLSGWEAAG